MSILQIPEVSGCWNVQGRFVELIHVKYIFKFIYLTLLSLVILLYIAIQMGRPSKVRYTNDPIRPRPDHWNNESKVKRIKISNAVNASNNLISQSS